MTPWTDYVAGWLADYYLLSTALLALTLGALRMIRQPAKRRAVTQAVLIGLIVMAALCAIPGWSIVSISAKLPSRNRESEYVASATPDAWARSVEGQRDLSADRNHPNSRNSSANMHADDQRGWGNAPVNLREASRQAKDSANPTKLPWREIAIVAWSLGAVASLAWLGVGWWAALRLRRNSSPAPDELARLLGELVNDRTGSSRAPQLRTSPSIDVPAALGIWRPIVLLPATWLQSQSRDELRSVLAHEAAHLRNRDLHWLAVSRALQTLLWAQPLFWLMRRRMRLDQETLADAAAAEITGRQSYAEKLVALARLVATRPTMQLSSAVGLWEGPSQLRQRIEILIDEPFILIRRCSQRWRLGTLALAAVASVALSVVTLERQAPAEPAADDAVQADFEADANETNTNTNDAKDAPAGQDDSLQDVPMDLLEVRVVDSAGKPIASATLRPYAFRVAGSGGHFGWSKGKTPETSPQESTTDESGIAAVRYPAYFGKPTSKTKNVSLTVRHPDYVAQSVDVPVSNTPTKIRLASGGSVEIVAKSAGEVIRSDVFGLSGGLMSTPWRQTDDGKLRSPRLSTGKSAVRAVWLPKEGPAQFSRMNEVNVTENGITSVKVDLQPGVMLAGTLSDTVPRPVKNGIAMVCVEMPGRITWHDWTPINKDGSFEFESLPGGDDATAQIAVICDGYVSKPPAASNLDTGTGAPQRVPLAGELVSHVVDMIPTASAKVLLTEQDGKPISGVRVSLCPNITWSIGSAIFSKQQLRTSEMLRKASEEPEAPTPLFDEEPYQAISDDNGLALIENVPPFDPPYVMVQHDRFQLPIVMQTIGTTRVALLKLVPGKTNELELVLEPTPTEIEELQVAPTEVAGTVVGPDGKPLAGVIVDTWTWYKGNETKTDERGRFRLKGFEANSEVEIEFRKKGYGPRYFVDQRAGTSGWTVQMDDGTFLEGTVTDRQGKTVPNAVIRAERGPFENPQVVIGEVPTETLTDDNGHYRLYLEPATYSIKVRVPDRGVARFESQSIAAGEQKRFNIKLDEGLTFRANILDSETGKPVEGLILWNWRLKGIEGKSNAEGALEVSELFPGKLEFNVTAAGENRMRRNIAGNYARWWSEQALNEHQRKKSEPDGFQRNFDDLEFEITRQTQPVTIYVEPCVTITGRVVDPDGKPVAGATVAPAKTGSGNSLTGDTRFSYETKKDGTFEMELPASGVVKYNLIAHDGKYGEWRQWANAIGEPFSTKPGQKIENVELKLQRPATIRGQVLIDGEPASAGKEVGAADAARHSNRYYTPTTKTDAEGRFELKFVAPGRQVVGIDWAWLNADINGVGPFKLVDVEEGATIDDVEIRSTTQPVGVPGQLFQLKANQP